MRNSWVERSETLLLFSVAMDWNPPPVAKANQLGFAWCQWHGANRMAHTPQKVVTSGIACNTISRKWWPISASQSPKPFDGSTSASVSLRSVEPSSKSPFEDQLPDLIDTVRNSWVERSETLLLLSVAMDGSPPPVAIANQPSFAWCQWHGANRMVSVYKSLNHHFQLE